MNAIINKTGLDSISQQLIIFLLFQTIVLKQFLAKSTWKNISLVVVLEFVNNTR